PSAQVDESIADSGVLVTPLVYDGYPSIGCRTCTMRVEAGAGPRSGPWAGTGKNEGGIHVAPRLSPPPTAPAPAVVVPLLLTAAYHSKADIPAQLAAAAAARPGLDVVCAGTLGPHPLLLAALERRLREAGAAAGDAVARARTGVVLAAAGSSDPAANAT